MLNIPLAYLEPGMVVALPIHGPRGDLLLNKGVEIQPFMVAYLRQAGFRSVHVHTRETEDIEIREAINGRLRTKATLAIASIFDAVEEASRGVPKNVDDIRALMRTGDFKQKVLATPVFNELPDIAEEVVGAALELELLSGLGTLKSHDDCTFSHSVDVAVCSVVIGKQLKLKKEQLHLLAQGAMLHDIGKVFVEHAVLNKPAGLDPYEMGLMREHPMLGFEMIREANIDLMPKHVALQHHERQDGSGYPKGATGTNRVLKTMQERDASIALIGEIAAVADVYDALSSDRPYRPGLPPDEVAGIIASMAGTHLNAEIVRSFLNVLEMFPVGLNIRIIDGRYKGYRGVVIEGKPWRMDRPTVRLLRNATGSQISPIEVDLELDDTHLASVDKI